MIKVDTKYRFYIYLCAKLLNAYCIHNSIMLLKNNFQQEESWYSYNNFNLNIKLKIDIAHNYNIKHSNKINDLHFIHIITTCFIMVHNYVLVIYFLVLCLPKFWPELCSWAIYLVKTCIKQNHRLRILISSRSTFLSLLQLLLPYRYL